MTKLISRIISACCAGMVALATIVIELVTICASAVMLIADGSWLERLAAVGIELSKLTPTNAFQEGFIEPLQMAWTAGMDTPWGLVAGLIVGWLIILGQVVGRRNPIRRFRRELQSAIEAAREAPKSASTVLRRQGGRFSGFSHRDAQKATWRGNVVAFSKDNHRGADTAVEVRRHG